MDQSGADVANVIFDVTRYYQVAQDTAGVQYLVQDGNWYLKTTQVAINIIPNGWKFIPQGMSSSYPGNALQTLVQGGLPMYMPGTGTLTAAGVLALTGTALDQTFANAYFFFPANAVGTGLPAGMYFVQMTSVSAGTVFQNPYTGGTPLIPTTLIPCVSAGNYTQTTGALVSLVTGTVPAATMGPSGKVKVICGYQNNNSGGTKTFSIKWGGTQALGTTATTNQSTNIIREICNTGLTNAQASTASGAVGTGASAGASQRYTKDTTASQDVTIQGQLGTATDWVGLDSYTIEVTPN